MNKYTGYRAGKTGEVNERDIKKSSGHRTVTKNPETFEGSSMEGPEPGSVLFENESRVYTEEIGRAIPDLSFDRDSVIRGLIFSEILAKPKCKRMGRG